MMGMKKPIIRGNTEVLPTEVILILYVYISNNLHIHIYMWSSL